MRIAAEPRIIQGLSATERAQIEISVGSVGFSDGATARVVFASRDAPIEDVARALDVPDAPGVVVLNGGAQIPTL